MFRHLHWASHPLPKHSTILPNEEKWPIIIFSHGLGGHGETYTQIVLDLASFGYVVVCPEHQDRSSSYAKTFQGHVLTYQRPPDIPYLQPEVSEFRQTFLTQRVNEIRNLITNLKECKHNNQSELVIHILNNINISQLCIAGHSFGAATAIKVAQSYKNEHPSNTIPIISGLWLLDIWSTCLDSEVLNKGVQDIPICSVLSEQFAQGNICIHISCNTFDIAEHI